MRRGPCSSEAQQEAAQPPPAGVQGGFSRPPSRNGGRETSGLVIRGHLSGGRVTSARAPGGSCLPPFPQLPCRLRKPTAVPCVCVCVCPSVCVCVGPAGSLPYEYKIVIAGNHELTFDQEFMADLIKQDFYYFPSVSKLKPENYENVQSLLTNCIYLQDSEVTVRGFRIYGSPW